VGSPSLCDQLGTYGTRSSSVTHPILFSKINPPRTRREPTEYHRLTGRVNRKIEQIRSKTAIQGGSVPTRGRPTWSALRRGPHGPAAPERFGRKISPSLSSQPATNIGPCSYFVKEPGVFRGFERKRIYINSIIFIINPTLRRGTPPGRARSPRCAAPR